jgi:hypothetical protein
MQHPLIPNLDHLNLEELQEKITELTKKLSIVARSGNGHLCNQIRMALESYNTAYQNKIKQQQMDSGKNFDDKISIS